ncbi:MULTISPECIES: Abi family protein [unclassified Rathayibacter]|uniref:Abi family protein n=1 Tax=unclassified Rathayibacter TaxID=2609250 RepID=UPI00105111CB|nr:MULTISPECIES: Abi family protein [unclassified Rathayibacter]TCL79397.1 abortive infection bacteriophage resistance protein [Rathayibacter sp. PhB192]TCM25335.1 abortive infection bacteriophage resistance protein [Rathayibacter sp. PhB179]
MLVADRAEAERLLRRVGYYRLSGYWYPYREREVRADGTEAVGPRLREGITLSLVTRIYEFDRELRSLMLDALETAEVALRFEIGHTLGRRSVFAHRDPACLDASFSRAPEEVVTSAHTEWLAEFDKQEGRSQEAFALHFREKYGEHFPVWVATEVMTFGTLTRLYSGAKQADRELIALKFDVVTTSGRGDAALFSNWLNQLRHMRNLCAHHSRLWNRVLNVELSETRGIAELADLNSISRSRVYGTITVLAFLLARISPGADWQTRVRKLIEERTTELALELASMGFPPAWEATTLWQPNYRRDPSVADRMALIADVDLATGRAMRDRLLSRAEKERRSWLNYLRQQHALIRIPVGDDPGLYPSFQISETMGDIHPAVGDINETLHGLLSARTDDADQVSWLTLRWWTTADEATGTTPIQLLEQGGLSLNEVRPELKRFAIQSTA